MEDKNTKRCTKCGQVKPIDEFYWNNKKHTKRKSRCKPCCVDEKLKRKGITRRTPYRPAAERSYVPRYCKCGNEISRGVKDSECSGCQRTRKRREADVALGGQSWAKTLRKIARKWPGGQESAWQRKMASLVQSGARSRRSKCEKRRKQQVKSWDWQGKAWQLAKESKRPLTQWERAMRTKARNWRRKLRSIDINVREGNGSTVVTITGEAGTQMCFEWARADA